MLITAALLGTGDLVIAGKVGAKPLWAATAHLAPKATLLPPRLQGSIWQKHLGASLVGRESNRSPSPLQPAQSLPLAAIFIEVCRKFDVRYNLFFLYSRAKGPFSSPSSVFG